MGWRGGGGDRTEGMGSLMSGIPKVDKKLREKCSITSIRPDSFRLSYLSFGGGGPVNVRALGSEEDTGLGEIFNRNLNSCTR